MLVLGVICLVIAANVAMQTFHARVDTPVKALTIVPDAQAVIVGNSQYLGLDSFELPVPMQLLALPGTGYSIEAEAFLSHAPGLPHVRLLMLGFCNTMLRMQDIQNRKGDYDDVLAWGIPWYRIPSIGWPERLGVGITLLPGMGSLWAGPNLAFDAELWNRFLGSRPILAASQPTQLKAATDFRYRGFEFAPGDGAGKMAGYIKWLSDSVQAANNRAALFRMLAYCNEHQIDVALLRSPTARAYWQARPEPWSEELARLYQEIKATYPTLRVMVWDAEHTLPMPDAWFYDGNHMNDGKYAFQPATEEFAAYLKERVRAWKAGTFPDDGIDSVVKMPTPKSFSVTHLLDADAPTWESVGDVQIVAAPVPGPLLDYCGTAQRITMGPGAEIRLRVARPLAADEAARAQAWIGADGPSIERVRMELQVTDGVDAGATQKVREFWILRPETELLSATQSRGVSWDAMVFRLLNRGRHPVTLRLAGAQLDVYRLEP